MRSVFEYGDYRVYLKDAFAERKRRDSSFTHRALCRELGLKSSNTILLVMQGKRNLSSLLALRLADYFGLSGDAADYFLCMVLFSQADTTVEKEVYWRKLATIRANYSTLRIEDSQYEYYSHWYNPVIRDLLAIPGVAWEPKAIARVLRPRVRVPEVRDSLALMERLGLVVRQGGTWSRISTHVGTASDVHSVSVFQYHRQLLKLASQSLEDLPGNQRNVSSVTLELSPQEYQAVVEQVVNFRKTVLGVAGTSGKPAERVYQLTLQLFPVTDRLQGISRSGGRPS